jgi:hypothetical protein
MKSLESLGRRITPAFGHPSFVRRGAIPERFN